MSDPERYAKPGLYRDDDDHAKLLDENRDQYRQDRIRRLRQELENLEREQR